MTIGRQGLQARILDRRSDGEVVKALIATARQTQQFMHGVVEIAADAGAAHAGGFGRQVECLADQSAFPEQPPIMPGAIGQHRIELGQHPEAEGAVTGDVLMAGQPLGGRACVRADQSIQSQTLRRVGDEIQKSDHRRHEFNLILAKAVKDIGEMVKSLSETVGVMAGQPVRAPKSAGITTKPSQVLDALDSLMEKSMAAGMSGATDFGEDIAMAVAKYEQTNMISRPMLEAVKSQISQQRTAA